MTICGVIDSDNQLINTIVAEPTDPAPDNCRLVEIPTDYYWDGTQISLIPIGTDDGN